MGNHGFETSTAKKGPLAELKQAEAACSMPRQPGLVICASTTPFPSSEGHTVKLCGDAYSSCSRCGKISCSPRVSVLKGWSCLSAGSRILLILPEAEHLLCFQLYSPRVHVEEWLKYLGVFALNQVQDDRTHMCQQLISKVPSMT